MRKIFKRNRHKRGCFILNVFGSFTSKDSEELVESFQKILDRYSLDSTIDSYLGKQIKSYQLE